MEYRGIEKKKKVNPLKNKMILLIFIIKIEN
jgi:hypothetical protein